MRRMPEGVLMVDHQARR